MSGRFYLLARKGEEMSMRIRGIIKWYNTKKHFGFIVSDCDNREVFFHINDCKDFDPKEDLPVEFLLGLDSRGRQKALNIRTVTVGVENGTNNN
jgi:cold shock CspA family protein